MKLNKQLDNSEVPYNRIDSEMSETVRTLLIVIFFSISGIAFTLYLFGDELRASVILGMLPVILIVAYLIKIGKIRIAVLFFSVLSCLIITWSIVTGNGVHDIGMVAYPVVILCSSWMLRTSDLWILSLLMGCCVTFIVLGEQFGIFLILPNGLGHEGDVLLISFMLLVSIATTSTLTTRVKKSIAHVNLELEEQTLIEAEIETNIQKKSELFRELHHRVKNHLSFVNSLIDLETMSKGTERDKYKEFVDCVVAVARAHDQLYQSDMYAKVKAKEYLDSLISNYLMTYRLSDANIHLQLDPIEVDVAIGICLGIASHEIISLIAKNHFSDGHVKIDFILTSDDQNTFTILCDRPLEVLENSKEVKMLRYLSKEIGGEFELMKGEDKTLFEINFSLTSPHT